MLDELIDELRYFGLRCQIKQRLTANQGINDTSNKCSNNLVFAAKSLAECEKYVDLVLVSIESFVDGGHI